MIQTLVGIDPGASTGVVAVRVTAAGPRLVSASTLTPRRRVGMTPAKKDAELHDRLFALLSDLRPDQVALEEPADFGEEWRSRKRGDRRQQRGTSFRLGAYYGLAIAAAGRLRVPVVSYPVTTLGERSGWMRGEKAADVLARMRLAARGMGATAELSEHELMALGVAVHHLSQAINLKSLPR